MHPHHAAPPALPSAVPATRQPRLSPREEETLHYIAQGCTYGGTARRMGVSVRTVDGYLRRIRSKFGIRMYAELAWLDPSLGL
ncbi:response regulator transcription factor [Streptomyces sp. SAI-229]|uniref:response regulator transcription factor n=1 Tax=Streptomyces sp. SAI-229 TaxID=3377731 RepID=UPI003C7DDFB1